MKTLWETQTNMPTFPKLSGDIKTDVAIVGGGIAGLLTAYLLGERGVGCVVIEKGGICRGTTAHTTGKITVGHGLIYDRLITRYGKGIAEGYLRANRLATERYRLLSAKFPCDYERKSNYVYSLCDRGKIEREVRALDSLGERVDFYESLPLPFETVGAVCIPNEAQFSPLRFLSQIADKLNIYENTHVSDIRDNTVITDSGNVSAENIVVATHFPFIDRRGLFFMKLYQQRSYVLALRGAGDVGGMYVDESGHGLSFRNYGELLLLGGGGHRTGKQGGSYDALRAARDMYYPGAEERFAWAAQDSMSLDGMPYIGRYYRQSSHLFVACGFNKWGMSGGMLSAMLLSDMICGRKNEYAEIFSPSRTILHKQLPINLFETASNLLSPRTKRCTHLGCALKWNKAEHSWDCSCHGSRFSQDGKVIDNPANKDLK